MSHDWSACAAEYRKCPNIGHCRTAVSSTAVRNPNVFISYTHDNDDHLRGVREFANFLTDAGIAVILDQWEDEARQDWYAWAMKQMPRVDFILVVASQGYKRMGDGYGPNHRNLGGQAEAALLRDLLQRDRAKWTAKMLPVVLSGHKITEIPDFLQPYAADHYLVDSLTTSGAETLLRTITGQAAHIRPPLGPLINLPPKSGPGS